MPHALRRAAAAAWLCRCSTGRRGPKGFGPAFPRSYRPRRHCYIPTRLAELAGRPDSQSTVVSSHSRRTAFNCALPEIAVPFDTTRYDLAIVRISRCALRKTTVPTRRA